MPPSSLPRLSRRLLSWKGMIYCAMKHLAIVLLWQRATRLPWDINFYSWVRPGGVTFGHSNPWLDFFVRHVMDVYSFEETAFLTV